MNIKRIIKKSFGFVAFSLPVYLIIFKDVSIDDVKIHMLGKIIFVLLIYGIIFTVSFGFKILMNEEV